MALKRSLLLAILYLVLSAGFSPAHESPSHRISVLDRLILEDAASPDLRLERGELHRLNRNWAAAESDYRTAEILGADPSRVAACMAALALDQGKPDSAIEHLRLAPEVDASMLFIQGRALRALGRFSESADVFTRAIASTCRPRPEYYLELSKVYLQQGDPYLPGALSALDRGIDRLGSAPVLILAAADLEVRGGAFDRALERLDRLPDILGDSPAVLARRGEILLGAGRVLEAEALFTEALSRIESLPHTRRSAPATQELEEKLQKLLSAGDPASVGDRR